MLVVGVGDADTKSRVKIREEPSPIPAVRANSKVRWRLIVQRLSVTSPLQVACSVRPASVSVSPL